MVRSASSAMREPPGSLSETSARSSPSVRRASSWVSSPKGRSRICDTGRLTSRRWKAPSGSATSSDRQSSPLTTLLPPAPTVSRKRASPQASSTAAAAPSTGTSSLIENRLDSAPVCSRAVTSRQSKSTPSSFSGKGSETGAAASAYSPNTALKLTRRAADRRQEAAGRVVRQNGEGEARGSDWRNGSEVR